MTIIVPQPSIGLRAEIQSLYNEVYAEPPYCEGPKERGEFVERWNAQASQPGFRIVFAYAPDGDLVGFTFGLPLGAKTGWWHGLLDPIDSSIIYENGRRTFAIIELAVDARWRRQGVGRALHEKLLEGRAEERITLLVRPEPEAAPARAAYANWGYSTVGRLRPGGDAPEYIALLRPMRLS